MLKTVKATSNVQLVHAIRDVLEDTYPDKTVEYNDADCNANLFITKGEKNNIIKIHIQNCDVEITDSDIDAIIRKFNNTVYHRESNVEYVENATSTTFKVIE